MAEKSNLSLEQFKSYAAPEQWEKFIGKAQAGTFMECHATVRRQTGIWIEELTPVFLKLDALSAKK